MLIRTAGRADIAAIAEIERSAPSAWSAAQIAAELKHSGGIRLITRSEADDRSAGWCCARLCPPEAELLKITVLPQYRRSGVGSCLLAELLRYIDEKGCSEIFLEVRKNNLPALKFYHRNGFFSVALRKHYYQDPPDDGIILKANI